MAGMVPEDVYRADRGLRPARVARRCDGRVRRRRRRREGEQLPGRHLAGGARRADGAAAVHEPATKSDAEPRWSPDGSALAFTSNRDGDTMQLYVVPVAGGEARKLTALKEDVTQPVWSPDGTRLAFVARVPDAAYDEKDEKRRQPRRFTRLQYKLDDVGWTADRPQHLFTVRSDGSGEPVQLTSGDAEDTAPGVVTGRQRRWPSSPPVIRIGTSRWSPTSTWSTPTAANRAGSPAAAGPSAASRGRPTGPVLPRRATLPSSTTRRTCAVAMVDARQRRDPSSHRGARPQLRAVPLLARAGLGRRATCCSRSRTAA